MVLNLLTPQMKTAVRIVGEGKWNRFITLQPWIEKKKKCYTFKNYFYNDGVWHFFFINCDFFEALHTNTNKKSTKKKKKIHTKLNKKNNTYSKSFNPILSSHAICLERDNYFMYKKYIIYMLHLRDIRVFPEIYLI